MFFFQASAVPLSSAGDRGMKRRREMQIFCVCRIRCAAVCVYILTWEKAQTFRFVPWFLQILTDFCLFSLTPAKEPNIPGPSAPDRAGIILLYRCRTTDISLSDPLHFFLPLPALLQTS